MCNCDWSQSAVSKALACVTMSSMVLNWVAFARMSVLRVSLCKPHINWSLMLMLDMSVLQAGQLSSQSTAREHILMRKSFIDSPSLCMRLPKFLWWTARFTLFVTIFSMTSSMTDSSISKNVECKLMRLCCTVSLQALSWWGPICEEGRPVICSYVFQSMTNLRNCWFVISETMERILIHVGGGWNAAELCDVWSAAGAIHWIPMRTNCAPLLADLFLYSYENKFLDNMIRSGHRLPGHLIYATDTLMICLFLITRSFWIISKRYIHPSWLLRKLTNLTTWQTTLISHSS